MSDDFTNTTTANDIVYNKAIAESILRAAGAAVVAADKFIRYKVPTPGSNTITIPQQAASIVVDDLSEGQDQEANAVSTNGVDLTVARRGTLIKITDESKETSVPTFGPLVLAESGLALARKLDSLVLGLASGFTGNAVSLTGAAFTFAGLQTAIFNLEDDNAPTKLEQEPMLGLAPTRVDTYMAFLAPVQVLHLSQAMTTAGAAFFTDPKQSEIAKQNGAFPAGYKGSVLGIPVYQSTQVQTSSSDRVALVASPLAIAVGVRFLSTVESQRNVPGRSDAIAQTASFGVIELMDSFGASITSKSAA